MASMEFTGLRYPRGTSRIRLAAAVPDAYDRGMSDPGADGEVPEVRGPVLSLVLLLTGRTVVVPALTGAGALTIAEELGLAPRG